MKSDWKAGWDARERGDPNLSNPHIRLTEAWFDWAEGWDEADIEIRNKGNPFLTPTKT